MSPAAIEKARKEIDALNAEIKRSGMTRFETFVMHSKIEVYSEKNIRLYTSVDIASRGLFKLLMIKILLRHFFSNRKIERGRLQRTQSHITKMLINLNQISCNEQYK